MFPLEMMMRTSPEFTMVYGAAIPPDNGGNVSTDPYENMTTEQVSGIIREQIRQNRHQTNEFTRDVLLILHTIVCVYILVHFLIFILYCICCARYDQRMRQRFNR